MPEVKLQDKIKLNFTFKQESPVQKTTKKEVVKQVITNKKRRRLKRRNR